MAYPGSFHRIVVIGSMYTAEQFNFTINVAVPSISVSTVINPATQVLADSIKGAINTWWPKLNGSGGVSIPGDVKFSSVKVNRINSSGHYQDPVSFESINASPVAGGSGLGMPPQLAIVVSLRTTVPRGPGSHGRFYLPNPQHSLNVGTDGRMSAATAGVVADGAKALVDSINTVYSTFTSGAGTPGRVVVASAVGAGAFRDVTHIEVGRVVDTIRSRRSSLAEDYQARTIA